MKRKFFFLLSTVLVATTQCFATIAYPGLVEFKQPNGNIVKVSMRGSETLKWAETEDGYTLMYDSIGNLVYAELDVMGDLVPTNIIATEKNLRPTEVEMRLMSTPKQLNYSQRQINMAEQIQRARNRQMQMVSNNNPVVGTRRMLLVLVDFPDYPFQKTKKDFDLLMNQLNYTDDGRYGSVRDFYRENSFGQLDLITDVVGIYRLQYERAYYGGNNGYSNDNNPWAMALEAITKADSDVDFSNYDNDGDGIVDGVHVIYAGPGEEAGGGSDCIWAHMSSVNTTVDGLRTSRYSCSPEIRGSGGSQMTHIGVICHEIGHVLGTMDFYDTNYATGGQYPGTGNWDLMASGNWNGDGACPAHFNPYSKIYDYGWATPVDGNQAASFTLDAKSQSGFVRIDTQTDGEFFLLEYRAKSGFDLCIPYHGLMVYRASDGLSRMSGNTLNAFHKQQFYPIVANAANELPTSIASTYGSVNTSSAPFPGSLGVDELTDFTTPSMKSWIGVNTEFPITSIKENVSNESVTFDIAGGTEGGAYSFKVTDSDTLSITLGWKTPASETVVLAFSTEPTFGVPENRDYTVGEGITGGGEVIYAGNGTTFKHCGLEQQTEYYYKLFTLRTDGTYSTGRQLKAETAVGVIRKFPYVEDFSSMLLPTTWKNELIIGEEPWKVAQLYETGDWMLIYEASFVPRRKARIIMPVIDFTDINCALLSFDYRNYLQKFEVAYRTSPTDEWHLLKSIEAREAFSNIETTNGIQHIDFKLPDLSSNYEIAFVVDYTSLGNSISSAERLTVDNIKLETDFNAFVSTPHPTFISSTMAQVKTETLDGTEGIIRKGIQWSIDKSSWMSIEADANGIAMLTSLPIGTTIYYRGYGIIASGEMIYGKTMEFTTLSFTTGSGTEEDPYLIGNTADWTSLKNYIDEGNDCQGLTFALRNSFTLTDLTKISKTFNGIIDGKGNSITLQTGNFNALFETIGNKGVIKNLTVKSDYINPTAHRNAIMCIYNSGTIVNCNVYVGGIDFSNKRNFGGICSDNNGYIANCHSEMYVTGLQPWCGGICWYNKSLIVGCSFKGEMSGNNNAKLGGIASLNYTSQKGGKETAGMIVECVNNGTLRLFEDGITGPQNSSIGGISGGNYGQIIRCVNKGDIVTYDNGGASGAGITGGDQGKVLDCYNLGKISVLTTPLKYADNSGTAGIVARMRIGSIKNCFSLTSVYADNSSINEVHEILGYNESTEVSNCYFAGAGTDEFAEQRSLSEFATQEMADLLNENGKNFIWEFSQNHPILMWERTGVNMAIDYIVDLQENQITIPWIVSGKDISLCGIEWRKEGTVLWNRIEGSVEIINKTIIENLPAKTSYELRLFAITTAGEILYSNIERAATLFASTGLTNDPHLITDYSEMVAFADMIACGESFAGEIVKLTCDLDLKGEENVLWKPMISEYAANGFNGEFDGAGHVISHMHINTHSGFAGFFGRSEGYIHDLSILDSKIMCHAKSKEGNAYGGTGGIVGYGSVSSAYPYLVERCGFEGTITGGHSIGGIVGEGGHNAVNDCYAKGTMKFNHTIGSYAIPNGRKLMASVGGIIGEGSASNSYFVGEVLLPVGNWGEAISFGIGWGPIAGLYYLDLSDNPNVNCYYNATSNEPFYTYADDISMTAKSMQSDSFLNSLTANIWTRANHINDGYPIFASRSSSRVTTSDAEHADNGDIAIYGIYTVGVDKEYHNHGFQWYSKMGDKQSIVETTVDSAGCYYSLVIPNQMVTDEGVNYRAFATQDGDSIFGEWKSFIPAFRSPQLTIVKIVATEQNTAELTYNIVEGTNENVYTFEYAEFDTPDNVKSISLDADASILLIQNLANKCKYKGLLVATSKDGMRTTSNPITWLQDKDINPEPNYTLGDPNNDGYIDVADLAGVVKFVLGTASSNLIKEAADMDGSGVVEVNDYVALVNVILKQKSIGTREIKNQTNAEQLLQMLPMEPGEDGIGELCFALTKTERIYTGLQLDLTLPDGVMIIDKSIATGNRKHDVWCEQREDNSYRILCSSMNNAVFTNDTIVRIKVKADAVSHGIYELTADNVVLSDTEAHRHNVSPMSSKLVIEDDKMGLEIKAEHGTLTLSANSGLQVRIVHACGMEIEVITLSEGETVMRTLPHGIYIINGKKIAL